MCSLVIPHSDNEVNILFRNTLNSATESASNAANQATNAVKGTTAEASKEGNKSMYNSEISCCDE